MPTQQYRCDKCVKTFERSETISEHGKSKANCPHGFYVSNFGVEHLQGTASFKKFILKTGGSGLQTPRVLRSQLSVDGLELRLHLP